MKNKFELRPPVENMKSRRTVFKIKKLIGPPRFKFILFLIEIMRNRKMRKPIKGIV